MSAAKSWIDEIRERLLVVIFGPYWSDAAYRRLLGFRDCLRSKGYTNTYLVVDFEQPAQGSGEPNDSYFLRKSEFWIDKCDVGFIVMLKDGDNTGVGQELRHLCDNCVDRVWRHTLFLEKQVRISSLVSGLQMRWSPQLSQVTFNSDSELCTTGTQRFPDYVPKLYYQVRQRQDFWSSSLQTTSLA